MCIFQLLSVLFSCRSFFELMLFFSKEEFVEEPLKNILDCFQVSKLCLLTLVFFTNNQSNQLKPLLICKFISSIKEYTILTWICSKILLQECQSKLLRHRNIYLHHVKQVIKGGGPWENPVLQRILKEAEMLQSEGRHILH